MNHIVLEHYFTCPYCWESISMLLDLSASEQNYVEDCEVCCHPINLVFACDDTSIQDFSANQIS